MAKDNKKNPWIAAIMNLILFGSGYLYLGKRKVFGSFLIVADLAIFLYMIYWFHPQIFYFVITIPTVIAYNALAIGLAIDAYNDAKSD